MYVKKNYKEIGDFVASLYPEDVSFIKIGKELGVSSSYLHKIFEGEEKPIYSFLLKLVENAGGTEKTIKREADNNGMLLFYYWKNLYPEERDIKDLNIIIRNEIDERKLTRKQFCMMADMRPNNLYSIETGSYAISYAKLKKIADALNVSTNSLIKKLLDKQLSKETFALAEILIRERKERGWNIVEASEALRIPYRKYERLEKGAGKIAYKYLPQLASEYGLDFNELLTMVYNNNLISKPLPSLDDYNSAIKKKETRVKTGEVDKYLMSLLSYEKIKASYDNKANTYKTSTIIVLMYLILTNQSKTKEQHKLEIIYYLKNIHNKDFICDRLIRNSGLSLKNNNIEDIFEYYKEYYQFSYSELAELTGISKSTINQTYRKALFRDPHSCDVIYGMMGIPSSVGYEYIISQKEKEVTKPDNVFIDINDIQSDLSKRVYWSFYGQKIVADALVKIFSIITDKAISPTDKYYEIKRINLFKKTDADTKSESD